MDKNHLTAVPALLTDEYQTLGQKTYWLFVSKWLETPFIFLIVAIAVSIARRMAFVPAQYQKLAAGAALVCFGIAVLSFLVAFLIARFVFRSQTFHLSPDAFKIRTGIFTKQEIAIPYRQIQNVHIERTFGQQMFGVSGLIIVTAGQDDEATDENESKGVLETIDKDLAIALQEELLRRADVQKVITVQK